MSLPLVIHMFSDEEEWARGAVNVLLETVTCASETKSEPAGLRYDVHLCLAGGSTPVSVYRACASDPRFREAAARKLIHLWVGDEREAPAGSGMRNSEMIESVFADMLADGNAEHGVVLHAWPAGPREKAAAHCVTKLGDVLDKKKGPVFDLVILGMGEDGHTAGLFSMEDVSRGDGEPVLLTQAPVEPKRRMTMAPWLLKSAARTVILIKGLPKLRVLMGNLFEERRDPIGFFIANPENQVEVYACR